MCTSMYFGKVLCNLYHVGIQISYPDKAAVVRTARLYVLLREGWHTLFSLAINRHFLLSVLHRPLTLHKQQFKKIQSAGFTCLK